MRRLKTACSTRMSTHDWWFDTTRYHSSTDSPSSPRASIGSEPITRKIALLVPIQPSASAVMTRLSTRLTAGIGSRNLTEPTAKSTRHQAMTLTAIAETVTTPLIVEPLRCFTG